MSSLNNIKDYTNITLCVIKLFKKYNNGIRILPLCKIIHHHVKKYNDIYSLFFLENESLTPTMSLKLIVFIKTNFTYIPYDILEKIVYHNPRVLELNEIIIDKNLVSLMGEDVSILSNKINTLPHDVQLAVIQQNPFMIKDVENQTEELCLQALSINELCFKHINPGNITDKVAIRAISHTILNFKYIINPSENVLIEAIKIDPSLLKITNNQSDNVCFAALEKDIKSYQYIKFPSMQVQKFYNEQINKINKINNINTTNSNINTICDYTKKIFKSPILYSIICLTVPIYSIYHIRKQINEYNIKMKNNINLI